jgi:hypothetical protein
VLLACTHITSEGAYLGILPGLEFESNPSCRDHAVYLEYRCFLAAFAKVKRNSTILHVHRTFYHMV